MLDFYRMQLEKQGMKTPEEGLEIQLLGNTFHSQSMKPSKFMLSFCLPISWVIILQTILRFSWKMMKSVF